MTKANRIRWALLVITALVSSSAVMAQTPAETEEAYEESVAEGEITMREAARIMNSFFTQVGGSTFLDMDEADAELNEIQKEALAAVKRIEVCPEADEAGRAMSRGDFAAAAKLCRKAIKANPNDAYSLYLCGLAELEQQHYAKAAKYFKRVTKPEPKSPTSVLLVAYAEALSKAKRPISDETIMLCYDQAKEIAEKRFPSKSKLAGGLFGPPPLARDPLLYKLEAEALAGRGPLVADTEALAEAALKLDDTYALLAVALGLEGEEDATRPLWLRLKKSRHATVAEGIKFLCDFYDEDDLYEAGSDEFKQRLAKLRQLEPDEGLWLLLSVPYKESPDLLNEIPLSDADLELVERAVSAKRFTLPEVELQEGLDRVCQEIGFPYQVDASRFGRRFNIGLAMRRVWSQRLGATVKAAPMQGDKMVAERALAVMQRVPGSYVLRNAEGAYGVLAIIRDSLEQNAAEMTMEVTRPIGKAWVRTCARARFGEVSRTVRLATCIDGLPASLPVPALRRADGAVMVSPLTDWNIRRAVRFTNTPEALAEAKRILSRELEWCQKGQGGPRSQTLIRVGALKQKSLAPILRDFSKCKLDDQALAALIWSTGELQDKQQTAWLEGLKEDKRTWVPILAAEALDKISGKKPVGCFQ